jgi:predicted RNase H-like HicB family nuclease
MSAKNQRLVSVTTQESTGKISARFVKYPNVVTQAYDLEELKEMLADAWELNLRILKQDAEFTLIHEH